MENQEEKYQKELKKLLPSELLNRIDLAVFFKPLSFQELKNILKFKIKLILEEFKKKGFSVNIKSEVLEKLSKKIEKNLDGGANYVENLINIEIKEPLKTYLSEIEPPAKVEIFLFEDNILIKKEYSYAPVF
ncbi:MAG: hypothetical protein WHV67_07030, partial [Thermoanaerobaculia bacterium]